MRKRATVTENGRQCVVVHGRIDHDRRVVSDVAGRTGVQLRAQRRVQLDLALGLAATLPLADAGTAAGAPAASGAVLKPKRTASILMLSSS